jgi:2'-5' RNA ligase
MTLYPPIKTDIISEQKFPLIGKWIEKQNVFELRIDGFGFFNKSKAPVVFARPVLSEYLKSFQRNLQRHICKNLLMPDNYSFTPHITLAFRDLDARYMPDITSVLGNREYAAAFIVDEIDILKHDGKRWQKFIELPLGTNISSDYLARQTELFS